MLVLVRVGDKQAPGMTSSLSSWVTARRIAESEAHSLPKRGATGRASSSNQSSLGDTAVAACCGGENSAACLI